MASGARIPEQELVVVVNLDNKRVVDHYNKTLNERRTRRVLKRHARALWNARHGVLGGLEIKLILKWQRARHNQLITEGCDDGEGNELVDKEARRGRDKGDSDGSID
jgi:hypothetical protein